MARRGWCGAPGGQGAGRPAGAEPEDALQAGAVPRPLKCGPVAAAHVTAQPLRPELGAPGGRRCGSGGVACCPPRAHPLLSRGPGAAAPRPSPRPALGESRFRVPLVAKGALRHRTGALGKGQANLPKRTGVAPYLHVCRIPPCPGSARRPQTQARVHALCRGNNFGSRTKGVQDTRDSVGMRALCDTTPTHRSQMTWKGKG